MRFMYLSSLKDAVQFEISLPINMHVRVFHVDTLGDEYAFVYVWQTTREKRAELDEVVDIDTFLFKFARACSLPRRLGSIVRPGNLALLLLKLFGEAICFFLLFKLRQILLRQGAHRSELRSNLIDFVPLKRMLLTNLFDLLVA